ncbi:MAG: ABC transporter permease subunit [Syntrophomonadaceae bacterium]|nr:ABC transporter permease subunit [Syntrophomonadaceae bacterium]
MQIEAAIKDWAQLHNDETSAPVKSKIIRPVNKSTLIIRAILLSLSIITVYTLLTMDYKGVDILKGFSDTLANFRTMFLQPHSERLSLLDAFYEVGITMGLAFLSTLFGAFIALILGLLAAQNLSGKILTNIIKGFIAFIRAVPTILWVLIFAVAAGLGSAAAVIGMTFHSISYLTKAYSESFESLDKSVIEALKASGADWWQIVFQAVIPSSITFMLSWTFLRFEINFANAVAMGAAAGAAGIGFDMFMASEFYFDIPEVGLITYFILAFAFLLELVSTNMKGRLQKAA